MQVIKLSGQILLPYYAIFSYTPQKDTHDILSLNSRVFEGFFRITSTFLLFGRYHVGRFIEFFLIKLLTAEKPYTYLREIRLELFIAFWF